jgi:hypothetical protein
MAIKMAKFVNSSLMFNKLQYREINKCGFVLPNCVLSLLSISFSKFLMMVIAFLHPFVAVAGSNLNISAISLGVLG